MLMSTSNTAPRSGRRAPMLVKPESERMIMLTGTVRISVTRIPSIPAIKPTMSVSARNTCDTSRFDAPMARRIPISLIRSNTEI